MGVYRLGSGGRVPQIAWDREYDEQCWPWAVPLMNIRREVVAYKRNRSSREQLGRKVLIQEKEL